MKIICEFCKKEYEKCPSLLRKYKLHFCSNECLRAYNISGTIKVACKVCGKLVKRTESKVRETTYCSYKCAGKDKQNRLQFNCAWCSTIVERIPAHVKKLVFCSCSCRAKYYIRQRQGFRRSYAEEYLSGLIKLDFPAFTLLENKKNLLPSGLEIDIFIEDKNLAIELNGPCHYFGIYGKDTLLKVQQRDAIKHAEIQEKGFQFIILDISTISDRGKLRKFIDNQYIDNIKPLLT